jgi:hypothetical protein
MDARAYGAAALALLWSASAAPAQEASWQSAGARPASLAGAVRLGRPAPLAAPAEDIRAAGLSEPQVRGQSPDPLTGGPPPPPPPPPPLPGAPPAISAPPGTPNAFDCGTVNSNADQGSFWGRCGNKLRRTWTDVTGGVTGATNTILQPGQGRTAFQSDHCFDTVFISPVSNPFFFEDPRSLTELRPIFMWQHTPNANPVFHGGNNYFLDLQARVAFTPWLSLVIDELGYTWTGIDNPASGYQSHAGFSEVHLGPKFTFLRNETTRTVMAGGLTFEIPTGADKVFQGNGTLSLVPYLSLAQNFWRTDYGSLNFMNTTGYAASVNNERSDGLFSSFHVDYNVGNLNKIFPLIELNWWHYTYNGNVTPFDFGGSNLFNFGSNNVAGRNDLTLALGARYKVTEALQFGIAPEVNLLNNSSGRHLDAFRLTVDMIFRY